MARNPNGTFARGTSGNPGGRPKEETHVRELARDKTAAAIKTLTEIMENSQASASARVSAASAILDRGWGKPLQPNANAHRFDGENPWKEILDLVGQIPTSALEAHLEELETEDRKREAQQAGGRPVDG